MAIGFAELSDRWNDPHFRTPESYGQGEIVPYHCDTRAKDKLLCIQCVGITI